MTDGVCQFCLISRGGVRCTLYNDDLSVKAGLIEKLPKCCRATDGKGSEIISDEVPPDAPTIPPSDLMKQTLDLYSKTVKDLMAQGYPRSIAETAARKHILGGN